MPVLPQIYGGALQKEAKVKVTQFQKFENIVMSPHRAGYIEGCLPHLDDAIRNIQYLINGRPLINIVNVEKMY